MTREKKKEKSGNFYLLAKEGGSQEVLCDCLLSPHFSFPLKTMFRDETTPTQPVLKGTTI